MTTLQERIPRIGGEFDAVCFSVWDENGKRLRDKLGRFLPRQLKWHDRTHNVVTNEGITHMMNVQFNAATTQITTWYCALVETNTAASTALTYAVPSFTESNKYDEATRPAYAEAACSTALAITNAGTVAVFTINASTTMYGAAILGGGTAGSTKANTAGGGVLFCYGLFSASRAVVDNDVINLTYALSGADDAI